MISNEVIAFSIAGIIAVFALLYLIYPTKSIVVLSGIELLQNNPNIAITGDIIDQQLDVFPDRKQLRLTLGRAKIRLDNSIGQIMGLNLVSFIDEKPVVVLGVSEQKIYELDFPSTCTDGYHKSKTIACGVKKN